MPVEPLAVRAEAEARLVIIRWLMHGSVQHEPVETLSHGSVGDRLEPARIALICPPAIPFPGTAVGGERFGSRYVLAIDMGHGRRLPKVRFHVRHGGIDSCPETHPECPLGHIGSPFNHHTVSNEGTPFLMGFAVALDAAGMEYPGGQVVVVLGQKLS